MPEEGARIGRMATPQSSWSWKDLPCDLRSEYPKVRYLLGYANVVLNPRQKTVISRNNELDVTLLDH